MTRNPGRQGAKTETAPAASANERPLGVEDIPGAVSPEQAARTGAAPAAAAGGGGPGGTAVGGENRARLAALLRQGGQGGNPGAGGGGQQGIGARLRDMQASGGGAGAGAGAGGQQALAARLREMQARGGAGGGDADPIARGRELIDVLKTVMSQREGGQRLMQPLTRIAEGYALLEQEVERLKRELADAQEQIKVLLDPGGETS